MITMVIFLKRKLGVSREDFQAHWKHRHAELILALPGLKRYVQNHALYDAMPGGDVAFDGIAESSFDDTAAMRALPATPEYQKVLADERDFIDRETMTSIITDPLLLQASASAAPVLQIDCLRRRGDVAVDAFFEHWRNAHAALATQLPGVRRYLQFHTRRAIYSSGRVPAYDGVNALAFGDRASLEGARSSAQHASLAADRARFTDPAGSTSLVAEAHVVLA